MAKWLDQLWQQAQDNWGQAGEEIDDARQQQEEIARQRRGRRRAGGMDALQIPLLEGNDPNEPAEGGENAPNEVLDLLREIRDTLVESKEILGEIKDKDATTGVYGP